MYELRSDNFGKTVCRLIIGHRSSALNLIHAFDEHQILSTVFGEKIGLESSEIQTRSNSAMAANPTLVLH